MARLLSGVFAIALSLSFTVAAFAQTSGRIVLELAESAAYQARTLGEIPAELSALTSPDDLEIVPIFIEPNDPDLRTSWYEHGLERWFKMDITEDPDVVAAQIPTGGAVLSVQADDVHHAQVFPDDYNIHNMWGLTIMQSPEAWDLYQADSDIIVTTIDTGCKISHEDLHANMWVNPGEDLNGNGFWDPSDINGIDDDNNGYTDDLTGYDFVSVDENTIYGWGGVAVGEEYGPRDNEVFPDIHGHGTHVMGTAAATTGNGIGVAAASWNAKAMPLRAGFAWLNNGSLSGSGFSTDFMPAIQYATDNGARVISISFGGPGYNQAYQDVISYARDNNVILFASAGNNGNDAENYPAAYDGAIAVVASNQADNKAGFSTYGTWVGITAPGTTIWSTMTGEGYNPQDYVAWQGTSMASPNAASVATYILGYMPDLTDDEVELVLSASADNIDSLNQSYAGLLGAGRVNMRRALEYAPSATLPVPDEMSASVDRATGEVTLNWYIDPSGYDDFSGYNVYRDEVLILEETLAELYVDQLPEPGIYTYKVRGVFGGVETLPVFSTVNYSGIYGLPVVDDFESEISQWEILNESNARRFPSRVWQGEYSLGVSAPNNVANGAQRYFEPSEGLRVQTWLYLSGLPVMGGQAGAIHLYSGDEERIEVYVDPNGNLRATWPGNPTPVQIGQSEVSYNEWYNLTVSYVDGNLHVLMLDEDQRLHAVGQFDLPDILIDGVLLGSRDLDNGWSFFDVASATPWPEDTDYYTSVQPNDQTYPIVVTGGIHVPLSGVEIAVMDGDLTVGAVAPVHDHYPFVLLAWGDPGDGNGFTNGNPMEFEIYYENDGTTEILVPDLYIGDGDFGFGDYTRTELIPPSDVEPVSDIDGLPREFAVGDAYPNPFNPSTSFTVSLPQASELTVTVYNILGQNVMQLVNGRMAAGVHNLTFDASNMTSGIYFLRVQIPGELNEILKLTLMK